MNNRIALASVFRSFGALLMAATATAPVNAYVHYGLIDNRRFDCAAFDAASEIVYAVNSDDGAIYRWETATQRALDTLTPPEESKAVAVLPDADMAISEANYENRGKFFVWKLSDGKLIATLAGEKEEKFVAVCPDGRTCATRNGSLISLWALPTGERKGSLSGYCGKAAFSRDGRVFASVEYDKPVRLWDSERGQAIGTLDETADVLLFSPDGRYLFTSNGDDGLVWDVRLQAPVARFESSDNIQGMVFSPDGLRLLVVGSVIHQWKYDPARFLRDQPATASERLAILSSKEQKLEKLPQLTLSPCATGFSGAPLAISPNGRWIASASWALRLIDTAALDVAQSTMQRRRVLKIPREYKETEAIAVSPDGRHIAAVGPADAYDDAVDLWDVETGKHLGAWKDERMSSVSVLSFAADSKLLAVCSGSSVTVLATKGAQPVFKVEYNDEFYKRQQPPRKDPQRSGGCPAIFGPNGTTMAWVGPWDNQVMLFDVAKRKPIGQFRDPTQIAANRQEFIDDDGVRALAFSRDGQTLVAGYDEGIVKLWDAKTGTWLRNFADPDVEPTADRSERSHNGEVIDVAMLPDGNVVTVDFQCLKFWDAKTGALIKKLDVNSSSLSIAPDGQSFATDEIIWDRSTMRRRANLKEAVGGVNDIAFSPDGAYLAVSTKEGVVLIDGEPFQGLFSTAEISQENTRWLGRTLTRLGYLNPEAKLKAAAYRTADVGHIALTLPQGAASDEIIVAAIRDEVGPVIAERLGPKIAIHLCTENFQVERTIEVERPLSSEPLQSAPTTPAALPATQPPVETPISPTDSEPAPQNTIDLQGAWRVETMIVNGKPTKFDPSTVYRLQDTRLAVETDSAPSAGFTYTMDTSTTPRGLDLVLHRPEGDAVARIIYKIEGEVLTMCYGPLSTQRPTDFASPAGSQRTLIVFRRANAS